MPLTTCRKPFTTIALVSNNHSRADDHRYNATKEKNKLIPAHGHLSGFVKSAQTTSNECEPDSVEPCPVGEEAEAGKESLTESSGGHASEPIPIINEEEAKVKVTVKCATIVKWISKHKDLLTCEPNAPMYCSICISASENNTFTEGCTNFKASALKEHLEGKSHQSALIVPEIVENN